MSAPDTNLTKQTKRHRGPLYGILALLAFVVALVVALAGFDTAAPEDEAGRIDVGQYAE